MSRESVNGKEPNLNSPSLAHYTFWNLIVQYDIEGEDACPGGSAGGSAGRTGETVADCDVDPVEVPEPSGESSLDGYQNPPGCR